MVCVSNKRMRTHTKRCHVGDLDLAWTWNTNFSYYDKDYTIPVTAASDEFSNPAGFAGCLEGDGGRCRLKPQDNGYFGQVNQTNS